MKPWSEGCRAERRGFTMIELLTVIAIIAILAGLLFPVMATVRESTRKNACISNMHQIVQAMKMYKDDWRVYPDALYGVSYRSGATTTPFALRLAGGFVKDPGVFTCPNHLQALKVRDAAKNPANVVNPTINRMTGAAYEYPLGSGRQALFSQSDSYDWQVRPNTMTGTAELHYTLKWTTGASGIADNPRQLLYKEPPDDTVVTWCLYHSNMNAAGNPAQGHVAPVAFLSGRVQTIDAQKVANWPAGGPYPWMVSPKP